MISEFFCITVQYIIIMLIGEEYFSKNKKWNNVFKYLNQGVKSFVEWRSDANIIVEMEIVPTLFSYLALVSIILMIILSLFGIDNNIIYMILFGMIFLSIIVNFSFKWVFEHINTIKQFKPIMYFYGIFGSVILFNIYTQNIYPGDLILLAKEYNIELATQHEMAISFIFAFIFLISSFYVFIWLFTLMFPVSILFILFTSSAVSKYAKNKLNRGSFVGMISILQLVVLYYCYYK